MSIEFVTTQPREWPVKYRGWVQSQFYPKDSSLYSESPFSGQDQYYGPQVTRFICNMTLPQMKGTDPEQRGRPTWRELSGFLASLRGPTNTVRLVDYHRMRCRYDAEHDPSVVNWSDGSTWDDGRGWANGFLPPYVAIDEAAGMHAESIVVRFPEQYAGLARVLSPGDLAEVRPNGLKAWHAHLYEIVFECRLDAQARTRVYLNRGLLRGVRAGDMLMLRYPTSVFRLAPGQDAAINRTAPGNFGNVGLTFREVLP